MKRLLLLALGALLLVGADGDRPQRQGARQRHGPQMREGGPGPGARKPGGGQQRQRQRQRQAQGEQGEGTDGPRAGPANMFLRQGNNRAAVGAFRKQLEANPNSAALNVGLAKALARVGQCEEALDHFWPYVGTLPFGGDAALAASTCSNRLGLLDDAVFFDRIAVEANPDSARALTNLALDLQAVGDPVGRDEALEELLFLRKDRDASAYARAVIALETGDLDEFDFVAFTWRRDDGPSMDLGRLQGQAWLDVDDPVSALAVLSKLKKIRAGEHTRRLRAEAHRRLGALDEARSHVEDQLQSVSEGGDSDAIRIRVEVDSGNLDAATAILAEYDHDLGIDMTASAWYLARARGDTARIEEYAARYAALQTNPRRTLEQLIPLDRRE